MMPLAMNFDNLHQVLRNLYVEMLPMCGDMIGVAKGVAGLGALFFVAYRVWKALANAEPIDVFLLLRPFAIGLCIMFFPSVVLGMINAVLSPVEQVALLEKSYEIAARYMNGGQTPAQEAATPQPTAATGKAVVQPVKQVRRNVVSLLAAPMPDSVFKAEFVKPRTGGSTRSERMLRRRSVMAFAQRFIARLRLPTAGRSPCGCWKR